jgi:hypothetical protein
VDGSPIHSWETWRTLVQNERRAHAARDRGRADGRHELVLVPIRAADGNGAAGLGRGIERTPVGLAGRRRLRPSAFRGNRSTW